MQRDMKCDVTCCTVTSASLLGILCLASGRSEDTRFTDKSMEQHQLLIQRSEVGSLLLLLQQQQRRCTTRREPTMRAITIDAYQTQSHLHEKPRHQPRDGAILIRI